MGHHAIDCLDRQIDELDRVGIGYEPREQTFIDQVVSLEYREKTVSRVPVLLSQRLDSTLIEHLLITQ